MIQIVNLNAQCNRIPLFPVLIVVWRGASLICSRGVVIEEEDERKKERGGIWDDVMMHACNAMR